MKCILNPLVSVVIPVYNTESFLENCLQSVVRQTYSYLEIIIVNDGSTDGSAMIIEKYEKLDNRIICINQKNQGLPSARRNGVLKASGKYIQHLDSDDYMVEDAIESLVKKAEETEADIVNASFIFVFSGMEKKYVSANFFNLGEGSGKVYLKHALSGDIFWTAWGNFHKRSLYIENSIELVPHISYGEDAILMVQLFWFAKKVTSLDKPIIYYNRHLDAMSHVASLTEHKYQEFIAFPLWVKSFIKRQGGGEIFERELLLFDINNLFVEIMFRRLDRIDKLVVDLLYRLKKWPNVINQLPRRRRKFFVFYRLSKRLGWWYMKKCINKVKL